MNKITQKITAVSLFVYDSIFVLEELVVEIIIVGIVITSNISFSAKEIADLRKVLRISIGNRADDFTDKDLSEFGTSMLQVTAVVLKAKYLNTKVQLNLH